MKSVFLQSTHKENALRNGKQLTHSRGWLCHTFYSEFHGGHARPPSPQPIPSHDQPFVAPAKQQREQIPRRRAKSKSEVEGNEAPARDGCVEKGIKATRMVAGLWRGIGRKIAPKQPRHLGPPHLPWNEPYGPA